MAKSVYGRAVLAIMLAATCRPAPAATRLAGQDVWFKVDRGNLFPGWRAQVQQMVDKPNGSAVNHVCVVGWQRGTDPATQLAYVIWPEQHRLITWIPSDDSDSLAQQTRVLDLDRDVVATEQQVNGSTYLVTRAWVANVRRHCREFGTTLTLTPSGQR